MSVQLDSQKRLLTEKMQYNERLVGVCEQIASFANKNSLIMLAEICNRIDSNMQIEQQIEVGKKVAEEINTLLKGL